MTMATIIDKIDAAASIRKAPADILTSHGLQRLKHESQSQWKERILSIDSTANSIKEDNTIALATSFEKASRKAKRRKAKEGTKKKGKNRNSLNCDILNRQATERQSQEAAMAISLQDRLAAYQNKQGTDEVVTVDDEKDDKDSCCIPQSCVTRATILVKLHQQVDQKKIDTSTTTKITTQTTGSLLRKNSKGKEAAVSMSLSERLAAYQKQGGGGGGVCEDDHTISTSSSMSYEASSQESISGSDIKERMAKLQRCNSSINDHPMSKQRKHDPKEAAASSMSLKDRLEAYQNHQVNDDEEKKTTHQTILQQHETSQRSSTQQQHQTKIESTTNNILLQSRIKEVDAATSVSLKERMKAYKNGVALDNENDDDEVHKNEDQSSQDKNKVTSEKEKEETKREVDLWFQRKQDKRSASYRAAAIAMKEEMNTEQLWYVVSEEQQLEADVTVPTRKKKKKNMLFTFIHRLFRRGNKKKGM